eukprot:1794073-Pleurochrysis_carterae.AAC.1
MGSCCSAAASRSRYAPKLKRASMHSFASTPGDCAPKTLPFILQTFPCRTASPPYISCATSSSSYVRQPGSLSTRPIRLLFTIRPRACRFSPFEFSALYCVILVCTFVLPSTPVVDVLFVVKLTPRGVAQSVTKGVQSTMSVDEVLDECVLRTSAVAVQPARFRRGAS